MLALLLAVTVSEMPEWAIPAIVGGGTLFVVVLGVLIFGRKSSPPPPTWRQGPQVRGRERPTVVRSSDRSNPKDKRTSLRRTGHPVDVQITNADATQDPRSALVIDRSLKGLCIAVDSEYKIHTLLNVRPATGDTSMPWVKVQVKNCRYVGKAYELGCEFLQVPPSSILILFG